MKTKDSYIILFDSECYLCNGAVQFIIQRDKQEKFQFASIKSSIGQKLLLERQLYLEASKSFVLIKEDVHYLKSTAALKVLKELSGLWKYLYVFVLMPVPIRNFIYELIANNRYLLFGKRTSCFVPSENIKNRFL